MKFELPALQSEPLIYFPLHSSIFVLILGALFFGLGLWFGGLSWRKYKGQCKVTHEKNQTLLGETAVLKRKPAEQSLQPTTAAAAPATPQTDRLAKARDIFPERPTSYPAPAATPTSSASAAQTLKAEIPMSATNPELPTTRSLGVHGFHQMANWKDKRIREFSNRLAVKNRITREGWVDRARGFEPTLAST